MNSNDYLCNVYTRTSYTVSVTGWWEKIINFNPTSGYEVEKSNEWYLNEMPAQCGILDAQKVGQREFP